MGIKHTFLAGALRMAPLFWLAPALAGPAVPTLPVGSHPAAATLALEGTVQAVRQATVASQLNANVTALLVKAGDTVRAGQALARLDDRDASAGLSRTEAGVLQAESERRNAQAHAERSRELRSKGFVSQAALDTAETQLKAAQAGLQQAQGARSQAALARGFSTVTAPFDGVVLATHLDAGDLATPGRAVLTLYAPGALRAVVQVPASRAAAARQATARHVQWPGQPWVQPVKSTELPATDPVAQTVEWRLDLPPGTTVSPGQSVSVRFEGAPTTAPSTSLTVPLSAVLRRGELEAVYLVQQGRFVLRAVRLGSLRGADSVDVLAGLRQGDVIAQDAVRAGLADAVPAAAR